MTLRFALGRTRQVQASLTVLAASLSMASAALAASFAGPSIVRLSQAATFSGSGFAPNSAVSIAVTAPGGGQAHFALVVAADGTLAYQIAPLVAGTHVLDVLDSGGKQLVSARFNAME